MHFSQKRYVVFVIFNKNPFQKLFFTLPPPPHTYLGGPCASVCGEVVCVPTQVLTSLLPISLLFVYIAPLRTLQACYPLHSPLQPYPSTLLLLSGLSSLSSFLFLLFLSCRPCLIPSPCLLLLCSFLSPVTSFLLPAFCFLCSFLPLSLLSFSLPSAFFVLSFPLSLLSFSLPSASFVISFPTAFSFFCLLIPLLFPSLLLFPSFAF